MSIQVYTGLGQLLFLLLFFISTMIIDVPDVKIGVFILWAFIGWIGTLVITVVQLFVAIKFRNFTFPILVSAMGSICGLMTLFLGDIIFLLFPYTQITIGMRSRVLTTFGLSDFLLFLVVILFYSTFFLSLSVMLLKRREDT